MKKRKKPADFADRLLERRLAEFSNDKTKEKYVRLLEAFRTTDVLVPAAPVSDELTSGNEGIAGLPPFKPAVLYIPSLKKKLMPVFSGQSEIPDGHTIGKTVFMHCADWIKAFRATGSEGVILNPFSELSFVLTPDQIRFLSLFSSIPAEYR